MGTNKVNLQKSMMMSLAEKKQVLLHMVEDADEKLTGLLIALAKEYNGASYKFSEEDLAEFNRRREG
ncbi:MAG: hypothetical protein NVSMB7_15170 [Chitinophagaceae bacterium]